MSTSGIIISLLCAALISGILFFLIYIGCFRNVIVEQKDAGPFTLVYREHLGHYKGTGKIQNEIYSSLLNDHKIETYRGFGIYYDDPKKVPTDKLRSIAGCILEEKDYDKKDYLIEKGYFIKEIPMRRMVMAEFPYKNIISVFVGMKKVYPRLEDYVKERNLSPAEMMEIYDIPSKRIIYLF